MPYFEMPSYDTVSSIVSNYIVGRHTVDTLKMFL